VLTLLAANVLAAARVLVSGHDFDWSAAAIGAAAGFGLALAVVGSIALLRAGRQ